MSRVYFHSPSETAELRGWERAWASSLIENMAVGIVMPRLDQDRDRLLELIPAEHYLHTMTKDYLQWKRAFEIAWRVLLMLDWRGQRLDAWTFSLNTALVLGNDQVRFLARMHAQCEIHGWVEGEYRNWLADVIERGRELGFYRAEAGWEGVIEMLRRRCDEPVVMSYSVTGGFPDAHASDWMPAWPEGKPKDWSALSEEEQQERSARKEAWYDLSEEEQWERSMRWLRAEPGMKAMSPLDWDEFRFGHGLSVFDLIAPDRDERLDRALVPEPAAT